MDFFGSDDEGEAQEAFENECMKCLDSSMSCEMKERLLEGRPDSFLQFHQGTEKAMVLFVERHASRGNASSVRRAIDVFCYGRHWMMHMGDLKYPLLKGCVADARARAQAAGRGLVCVEFGTYCGYTTLSLAILLKLGTVGGEELVTFEVNRSNHETSNVVLGLAGVANDVSAYHCSAREGIDILKHQGMKEKSISLVLLDHAKEEYKADLQAWVASGLMAPGCVIVADNIAFFGELNSDYLDYVRQSPVFAQSTFNEAIVEYTSACADLRNAWEIHPRDILDGVEISILA